MISRSTALHASAAACGTLRRAASAPRVPSLVTSGLLLFAATPGWSQADLQPVVVTATREPLALDKVTADIVLIDAERVRTTSADTVEDLLRREAGVAVSRNGGPGQNANVFIRGASGANTLVLIDGVRVGSATLGYTEFEGLALADIDHIEVLRGPASSLYGADAAGGVIQIFTRRGAGGARFGASLAAGGYGSTKGEATASGTVGPVDYAASLGRERSDGVSAVRPNDQFGLYNPDRDGYQRTNGQARLGWTIAPGQRLSASALQGRLKAQYDSSVFGGPPDFAQDASPDFRNDLRTSVYSAGYDATWSPQWSTHVQIARNEDDLRSGAPGATDRFLTRREQATAQVAWTPDSALHVVAALERLVESADAASLVDQRTRGNNAGVLGVSGEWAGNDLSLDLRHDSNSTYGGNTTGRLGWSRAVGGGFTLRALAGTTFRAPSYNDLYFSGYGVPTIRPERGRSVEAGLAWRAEATTVQLTLYRNRLRNLIDYQSDRTLGCPAGADYDFGCAANIGHARLQGATLSATQRVGALSLRGTLDLLDATDGDTGERLARRSSHQESVVADYAIGDWTLGAALLEVGARPDGGERLGAYTTVDLQARWRVARQWQIEAKLLNATNRDVEPARDYQGLGRQGWLGVRYDSVGL